MSAATTYTRLRNLGSSSSNKMAPNTSLFFDKKSINNDATYTLKLGGGARLNGTTNGKTAGSSGKHSVGSSESSDPLESDCSEEDEEEAPQRVVDDEARRKARTNNAVHEGEDEDEEEDDDDEELDEEDDDPEEEEEDEPDEDDDGNETDDEGDDDETDDSSSVETAKGVRKYHLDDFQIIKTVGE